MRIRNIQVSYSIPKTICKHLNIVDATVSLSGNNIKTWSKIENFDPETLSTNGEVYPQQRVINMGININF